MEKPDIKSVIAEFNKKHGDGSAIQLSEQRVPKKYSTGIPMLDYALGGGWEENTQNLIWGSYSSGKSALSVQSIVALQQEDPDALACIVDVEDSARKHWLEALGVDTDRVMILRPATAEDTLTQTMAAFNMGVFSIIIFDSLGALAPEKDVFGKNGKGARGDEAIYCGSAMIVSRLVKDIWACQKQLEVRVTNGEDVIMPVVIYIGQVRADVNSMYDTFKLAGGEALKHVLWSRVYLSPNTGSNAQILGLVNGEKMQIGKKITAKVDKNKQNAPNRMAGFNLIFTENDTFPLGVMRERSLYDLGIYLGVLENHGAWCYYKKGQEDERKANGADKMIELLMQDKKLCASIKADIDVVRAEEDDG